MKRRAWPVLVCVLCVLLGCVDVARADGPDTGRRGAFVPFVAGDFLRLWMRIAMEHLWFPTPRLVDDAPPGEGEGGPIDGDLPPE